MCLGDKFKSYPYQLVCMIFICLGLVISCGPCGAWYSGDRGVSRCRISSLRSETTTAITSVFVRKLEYFGNNILVPV